ncbi:DUF5655 domain-containing protein [Streptococcus uberis]|uniref:DUF5655 domain-containing protein n=2 Tax=Streptococcus uberis TaxID=1349 RepID=UPI000620267D|nr:DUF5655 domain-containing protein [Streptococcus uberis]AUC24978.1 DNA replication protein DnaC [Streptococcus uberis]KKF54012.1 DNA replication protein DnaC [Streptococcus uberis B190]MBY4764284.1 DUF5655 domain-containing protein [Streptococcus uberis]
MSDYLPLLVNKEKTVSELLETILSILEQFSPYQIEVKKTSLHLVKEKAFLGVHPKKKWLDLNIVSNQAIDHPLITKNEQVSKNRWHNNLRLSSVEEVDDTVKNLLQAAYLR